MNAEPAGLRRSLSPALVGLVAIGGAIGAGLFVGSSAMIHEAGPLVLVSYTLAGLLMIAIMRMLGEMCLRNPQVGSFINHIRLQLGPRVGFVAGWAYWLFWVTTAGSEVIAVGALLHHLAGTPAWLGELLTLIATSCSNLASARTYARGESVLSVIKVGAIVLFVALGVASAFGLMPGQGWRWQTIRGHGGLMPLGWQAGLAVMPIILQTLTGLEIATVAAAEAIDPVRSVDYTTRVLVRRVVLLYLASIAVILGVIPWNAIVVGTSPFATSLGRLGWSGADTITTSIVLVAVLSCANSAVYAASRTLLALAAERDAPASLCVVTRSGVPRTAVLTTIAAEILVAMSAVLSPAAVYVVVLSLSGALAMVDYLLAGFAHLRLNRGVLAASQALGRLSFRGIPILSAGVVATLVLILLGMAILPATRLDFLLGAMTIVVVQLAACWRHPRSALSPEG